MKARLEALAVNAGGAFCAPEAEPDCGQRTSVAGKRRIKNIRRRMRSVKSTGNFRREEEEKNKGGQIGG
jgi:hypothetical protein